MEVRWRTGDAVEDADAPSGKAANPIDDCALDPWRRFREATMPEGPDIFLASDWTVFLERGHDFLVWPMVEAGFRDQFEPRLDGPRPGCRRSGSIRCWHIQWRFG